MLTGNFKKLFETPEFEEVSLFQYPGVKQYFYKSIPWQGKITGVFACCGFPEHASADHPVPGVVLVHGGGATALADWVAHWNKLGFAAISMDTCGCVPSWSQNPYYNEHWPRHETGGPPGWGRIELAKDPVEEQWCYHALAAVILGHSFLRSFPQVSPDKIGVHGISWGGVLSLLAAAFDDRFCFAAPVYGCGFFMNRDSCIPYRSPLATDELRSLWQSYFDPGNYLERIKMPCLFLSGTNDFAFPFDSFWRSAAKCSGQVRHLMYPNYTHDHQISLSEQTVIRFAEKVVNGGTLPEVFPAQRDGRILTAKIGDHQNAVSAHLCRTSGSGFWSGRAWKSFPAQIKGDMVYAELPETFTTGFFNIRYRDQVTLSSRPYSAGAEL